LRKSNSTKEEVQMHQEDARTTRALGYTRLSKASGDDIGGVGLVAQRRAIEEACDRRGWVLAEVLADNGHGGADMNRPAAQDALARLARGEADVLVVSRLDRLSRSVVDFGQLVARSQGEGWGLLVIDMDVDTTTPTGELLANVVVSVGQFERRMIGLRTKEALAVKRDAGVRLGRPPALAPVIVRRIRRRRRAGWTLTRIADTLNSEGAPTAHGGERWWPSTVRAVLGRTAPQ
jgi:DNA invertase Pin-like site-specific DNA recombinase